MNRLISCCILLAVSHIALSDVNVDRYGVLPQIQKMTVSPNGERVAFRQVTLDQDVVSIIDVVHGKRLGAINLASVKPSDVRFIDNDNLLLNISKRTTIPGFKGEVNMSTASTYNLKNKKYKQLLVAGQGDVFPGQSGMGTVVGISPDGKSVYMPAFSGQPKYSSGRYLPPPMSLFKVKLSGAGKSRIYKRGRDHARDYFVGSNGKVIARETFDEQENKHSLFSFRGKKSVEIFSETTPYLVRDFIGLSRDEKYIFMVDESNKSDREAIYRMSIQDGAIEGPLYDREDADILRPFTDWQRHVIGVQYSGIHPSYKFFDTDLDRRVKVILSKFPSHSVWIEEISPDNNHILIKVEGSQAAGDYYLYSKGKDSRFIASSWMNIKTEQIHPIGSVTFKARDGLAIPTVVTIPRTRLSSLKDLPAIILPHGGPAWFDTIGFDYEAQALAEQGYLVLQPQFRGSKGLGAKHEVAGYGEWGAKAQDDLTDTVKYFSDKGMIDRNRVCIVGSSYGGYAALAGGAFTPDLYKCVVSINGVGNLKDILSWTRHERGSSSSSLAYWEAQILGFGEDSMEVAKQRSPEHKVDAFKAPVLLIYSEKDNIVPPRQSVTMYRALKKAGKDVEKVELKGDDHYLSNSETRLKALRATVEFVNKHI